MSSRRSERLSPPLMHAFRAAHAARDAKKELDLRDEGGDRVIAQRRVTGRSAITESLLRREVARDLADLMNTTNLDSMESLSEHQHVRRSILNYGFPDLAHRTIDEGRIVDISDEITTALIDFEPRLISRSIQSSRDDTVDDAELKIRFVVRADLRCDPVNVAVEFVADVELDSGKIRINRL
jgi:type VI secretion system protein ImpF